MLRPIGMVFGWLKVVILAMQTRVLFVHSVELLLELCLFVLNKN